MKAVLAADHLNCTVIGDVTGKVEETCGVERGRSGVAEETFHHAGQSWDCSQVQNEPEERDVMDWLEDDDEARGIGQ